MPNQIAAIGMCSWDRFLVTTKYPSPGEYAIVRAQAEQAGGTTSNTCAALARLSLEPQLFSCVGADAEGQALIASLAESGCDVSHIRVKPDQPTDRAWIVISGEGVARDRTIYWVQGARPAMGDLLPVDTILNHRWIFLDVDDPAMRSFWLDQPAHRSPRTKLIGAMSYLVDVQPETGWEHALRHDVLIGNERELLYLTGQNSLDEAINQAQANLVGNACQAIFLSCGQKPSIAIRAGSTQLAETFDVDIVDTTGAGDAFAAGCIWGLLEHRPDRDILIRGNTLGGLACRALGARASLPDRQEALNFISTNS